MKLDWALFQFPFDDPRWKNKALIGGAMAFVATTVSFPFFILMLPVSGYGIRIMKRTARGEDASLPEWDNWGELFMDGLKTWSISFVYGLPIIAIVSCLVGVVMVGAIGGGAILDNLSRAQVAAMSGVAIFGFYGVMFLSLAVIFIIGIPLAYLGAVATSRMAATGELSAAFEFGEVMKLARGGFKHFIIAVVAYLAAVYAGSMIATVLMYTLCLSCLYPFALAASVMYGITMFGAAFGQAYYHVTSTSDEAKAGEQSALPANTDQPATAKPATNPGKKTGPRKKINPDA